MATIDLSQLSSSPILSTDDSFVGRLNITTSGEQQNPVVTGLPNGNFVVVWADRAGNDGSEGGIFAQIYTSQFETVGAEFVVNSYTDYWQTRPEVSSTSSGDFLVTWLRVTDTYRLNFSIKVVHRSVSNLICGPVGTTMQI